MRVNFRNLQISTLAFLLACPFMDASAEANTCSMGCGMDAPIHEARILVPNIQSNCCTPEEILVIDRPKLHIPRSARPKACKTTPVKKKKHHRPKKQCRVKKAKKAVIVEEIIEPVIYEDYSCNEPIIMQACPPFPEKRVTCEIINPADLVDSTCQDFTKKLLACEAYTCQAPYSLDPSIKTQWQIVGKSNDRCVVSNTTDDIGIKDHEDNPLPITQMCEYDIVGVRGLIERFIDQEGRYYHYSTCEHFEGIHNCTMKSRGKTIQEAIDTPVADVEIAETPS